jgi:ABC-type sugar transport system substrate-binding protein
MKKVVSLVLILLLVLSFGILAGCSAAPAAPSAPASSAPAASSAAAPSPAESSPAASSPAASPEKAMKIAYFVSDMKETFHQAQFAEAKKYAKEKYGADVIAFDGKADSNTMTQNIDQIVAQGMDMATLHIWDAEAGKPGIQAALDKGVVMASFFSPVPGTGIPEVRNDEAGISEAMGKEMATQWKAAHPDKPIVMVELGWPNNADVKSGRTDPFVKGVLSVDPSAKDLGCLDASKGSDAAAQITTDLCTQHPEINLIYSESGGLSVGTMSALNKAGRGKVDKDGKPLTELVCSCDFDEVQLKEMFDQDSSLKLCLGLPPIETGDARIDNLFDIKNGKIKQVDTTNKEVLAKAFLMSYYSTKREDAVKWLNTEFGLSLK